MALVITLFARCLHLLALQGTINTNSAFLYTDTVDVCNNGSGWNLCANAALPAVAAAVEQQMLNR